MLKYYHCNLMEMSGDHSLLLKKARTYLSK